MSDFRFQMNNSKGFIGPIGDDLPSLIPLTFALVVFFSAFAFAFNSFDQARLDFDQKFTLLRIGKTLKADNLIDSFEKWNKLCQNLDVSRYQFRAVVFWVNTGDPKFLDYDFFDPPITQQPDIATILDATQAPRPLECPDVATEILSHEGAIAKKPLRLNFPVAVDDGKKVRPAILAVMLWR